MDQLRDGAPQDGLLVEQIGLRLLGETGRKDADAAAADRGGVGKGEIARMAARILCDREKRDEAGAREIIAPEGGAGALGRYEHDIEVRSRHDQLEADGEAVSEDQ